MLTAVCSMAMALGGPEVQDLTTKQARPKVMTSPYSKKPVLQNKVEKPAKQRTPGIALRAASGQQTTKTAGKAAQKARQQQVDVRSVPNLAVTGSYQFGAKMHIASGETIDEHGIIVAPADGVRKVYDRTGGCYSNENGFEIGSQGGQIHIVECEDGTYYIRNILSTFPSGTWVRGRREGNVLIVPTKQPVYYNSLAEVTYSIRWGIYDSVVGGFSNYDDYAENFTFEIDDENASLTFQCPTDLFMGLFWDDDLGFAWSGDYGTVWSYSGDFVPLDKTTITPPADLATETWFTKGHTLAEGKSQAFRGNITIGFDGQDVYLKGMFADFPDAWMKGTDNGEGCVEFAGLQLQGEQDGEYIYAVGFENYDLSDFSMAYDAENKQLVSNQELLANANDVDIDALTRIRDITIQATDPFAPIDELPYQNSFDSEEEWEWCAVIDANDDQKTWKLEEGTATYGYSEENAADDWLISPAIVLEAGKTYTFMLNTQCSSAYFQERIEVKLGNAVSAESMTQTVIEATDVTWDEEMQTLSNKFVTVGETGAYYFGIHAISDRDRASLKVDDLVVQETILDAPAAVTDLTVTADAEKPVATINFTAPVSTLGGEALTSNLTASIMRNGSCIKEFADVAPGSAITFVDDDPALTAGNYSYQVICSNSAGSGDLSEVVVVHLAQVMDIPYIADFTQDGVGNQFTQIDANEDYYFWEWDGGTHATYSYNSENAADDYLVSPALHLDAGKKYNIIVNAGSAGYPERFEVVIGREATVEGLQTKVIEDCTVELEDAKDFEGTYQAAETGVYYVAVHCISDADMYELWINKVSIEYAPEPTAPAAPVLVATPAEKGALSADISVAAPAVAVDGTSLTSNLSQIDLYRNNALIYSFADVAPGTAVSFTDADIAEAGIYTYQAIPYNASGVGLKSAIDTIYVGQDVPVSVTGVKAEDQQTQVLLTWDKTGDVGRNGGYVNPDEVEYAVYACEPGSTYVLGEPIAVVKDNFYTVEVNTNEGEQHEQTWVIAARNEIGESYLRDESSATIFMGAADQLPVVEGFANGEFHYYWDYVGTPLIFSQSSDDDGIALAMVSQQAGQIALTSGKLDISEAANPTLLFDAVGLGVSTVSVIGRTAGNEEVQVLGTAALANDAYQTFQVSLGSLKGGNYAQIGIVADITNPTEFDFWSGEILTEGDALILDNIRILDLYQHNLSVALNAPAAVKAGKVATVTATVTNWGEQPAKDYTVTLNAGEKELLNKVVAEELAPFESTEISVEMETSIFDQPGEVILTVKVDNAGEEKPEDNSATTAIEVLVSDVPGPENLEALNQGNGVVDLSWAAPSFTTGEFTEGFEDITTFQTFSVGGITATEHSGSFGEWTLYDSTGGEVYSWNSSSVHYDNQYAPSAWMPFNVLEAGFSENEAYDGSQIMLSMCITPSEELKTTDHWLISPELPGVEQLISFYLRTLTAQYGEETFEVLASKTDNKPESFELIQSYATDSETWMQFTASLPEGTRYFAIRHTSTDIFGVMLDNVTFTYSGTVSRYNIYLDKELIATVAGDVTTYTAAIDCVEAGDCTFSVTAVYGNGDESAPTSVSISVITSIDQITAKGEPVDIYSVDGKLVRSQASSLNGLSGVYVIGGNKVMIR